MPSIPSSSGDVRWTAGGRTICPPSLMRSMSFEPCLTELERTKNSRNTNNSNDAQQRLKVSLSVDQCRLPADSLSTQPATTTNSKTSESTAVFALFGTFSQCIVDLCFYTMLLSVCRLHHPHSMHRCTRSMVHVSVGRNCELCKNRMN